MAFDAVSHIVPNGYHPVRLASRILPAYQTRMCLTVIQFPALLLLSGSLRDRNER